MPELPDVEAFKKYADATVLNQPIEMVEFLDESMLAASPKIIKDSLKNHKFLSTVRIGKYLLLETDDNKHHWLVLHFGMTGHLQIYEDSEVPKYAHLLIHFKNGHHLALNDRRKLGKIDIADSPESYRQKKNLGPDALEISWKEFREIFRNKKGIVKSVLMDQHLVSGIGNVYADEILFQSKIHPKTKVNRLSDETIEVLFRRMQEVLKTAIKKEADPGRFPKNYLIPYRKAGQKCPVCGGTIVEIRISGRGTYFCASCQKEGK